VQIDYDVVHLRTSLVQLFVLLQLNFEEVVQIIELRRFGGAPEGYPFAALEIGDFFPTGLREAVLLGRRVCNFFCCWGGIGTVEPWEAGIFLWAHISC
jgi:hypothetical protein